MSCERMKDLVHAYLDDELSLTEQVSFEQHLATCPECEEAKRAYLKLRDDLRKPEKITSPSGRVSIAATRDEAGHADHFWSLALAVEAAAHSGGPFACERIQRFPFRRTSFI